MSEGPTKKRFSWANFGKVTLLFLGSLIFALGIVEIVLRFYNPLGFRIKGDKIVLPVNKNEIRHHKPSTKLDPYLVVHRNSLGFRGPEPPPDFARRLTIVTVGGSTTECLELADDKTWTHLLSLKLKETFPQSWVNNGGLSGHSTFGHLVLMEDYLAKMKPKVAIFLVGVNDLGLKDFNNSDRAVESGLRLQSFRSLDRFLGAFANHSEVAAALLNLKRYFFPKIEVMIPHQEVDLTRDPMLEISEVQQEAIRRELQRYHPEYEARLRRLITLARAHNISPVFITQPTLHGDLVDDVTGVNLSKIKVGQNLNGKLYWELLDSYNDVTRRVAAEEGVFVIDLAWELPKTSLYFYDPIHYSNQGAQKVAEIVSTHLQPHLARQFPTYVTVAATP